MKREEDSAILTSTLWVKHDDGGEMHGRCFNSDDKGIELKDFTDQDWDTKEHFLEIALIINGSVRTSQSFYKPFSKRLEKFVKDHYPSEYIAERKRLKKA